MLNGKPEADKAMQELENKDDRVATSIITAYELLKGAYLSSKSKENIAKVKDLLSNIDVLDLSPEACEEASQIYKELTRTGALCGEFDVLIAGIARAYDEAIVTRDEHFQRMSGLKTIKW